jgi:hypothetical protein
MRPVRTRAARQFRRYVEEPPSRARWIVLGSAIVAFFATLMILFIAFAKRPSKAANVSTTVPSTRDMIGPAELDAEWNNNPIAAENKFQGKTITIRGKISSVNEGWIARYYIAFAGSSVNCNFAESDRDRLAKLNRGQWVTIRGVVAGKLAGHIEIGSCEIID